MPPRFAKTLLPLLAPDQGKAVAAATEVIEAFPAAFDGYRLAGMRKKLGLRTNEAGDAELVHALLVWMQKSQAGLTNTFRELSAEGPPAGGVGIEPRNAILLNDSNNSGIVNGGQVVAGAANHALLQWQCVKVGGGVTVVENVLTISVQDRPTGPILISDVTFA